MPGCAYKSCGNNYRTVNKTKGITYHLFPADEIRRHQWITVVRKDRKDKSWKPLKSTKICSDHFKIEDKYISEKGRLLLKNNAIPFKQEHEICDDVASPSSLDNVGVSDLEDSLDTPRNAALEKCVRKLTLQKQELQKKNKLLAKQNKRLKIKIASMAVTLKTLRKQKIMTEDFF